MKKVLFYKCLINERFGLSADECILYSYLVYQSISGYEDVWDKESGKFDDYSIKECNGWVSIPQTLYSHKYGNINCQKIANFLGISRVSVWRMIKKFVNIGIIDNIQGNINTKYIYVNGFFELQTSTKLKGELLIFFSWLMDLKGCSPAIYAKRKKLACMYHSTFSNIRDYMHRLNKLGLVKRDENYSIQTNVHEC